MSKVKESMNQEIVEEVVEEVTEEVIVKPYTLRRIKNKDLWGLLKILAKILPEELKKAFVQVLAGEKKLKELGGMVVCDMATMIIKNMYKAEAEVSEFCADLAGITVEELDELEFGTTPLIIWDFYEEAKRTTFFKVLSKSIS